ncbi:hypothetical protein K438DRAFT_1751439 [Mycena galopus ATCC 62051]|nr:hypothetical protein K438DRAFT_1751439 [Mycena galopus ATCC 62051]
MSVDDQIAEHRARSLYQERPGAVYCNIRLNTMKGGLEVKSGWSSNVPRHQKAYGACECAEQEILWVASYECTEPKRVERLLHLKLREREVALEPRPCIGCGTCHREYFLFSAAGRFEGVLALIEEILGELGVTVNNQLSCNETGGQIPKGVRGPTRSKLSTPPQRLHPSMGQRPLTIRQACGWKAVLVDSVGASCTPTMIRKFARRALEESIWSWQLQNYGTRGKSPMNFYVLNLNAVRHQSVLSSGSTEEAESRNPHSVDTIAGRAWALPQSTRFVIEELTQSVRNLPVHSLWHQKWQLPLALNSHLATPRLLHCARHSSTMAKKSKTGNAKPKEMFPPYNTANVPDIMPFPTLAKKVLGVYQRVKDEVFESKAFQHSTQEGDGAEEKLLPSMIATWKATQKDKKNKAKNDKNAADDDSDAEEDQGARGAALRGYPKAGWMKLPTKRLLTVWKAIQKVVSNKREAAKRNQATKPENQLGAVDPDIALAKLFGLFELKGRDTFCDTRHDEISEHAKTLTGGNAGGRFRKAEAELRQRMVCGSVQEMVARLNAGKKFRPFFATMCMGWLNENGQVTFEWDKNPELVQNMFNAMHAWGAQALKDTELSAARGSSSASVEPAFPSHAGLKDLSPNTLVEVVTKTWMTNPPPPSPPTSNKDMDDAENSDPPPLPPPPAGNKDMDDAEDSDPPPPPSPPAGAKDMDDAEDSIPPPPPPTAPAGDKATKKRKVKAVEGAEEDVAEEDGRRSKRKKQSPAEATAERARKAAEATAAKKPARKTKGKK